MQHPSWEGGFSLSKVLFSWINLPLSRIGHQIMRANFLKIKLFELNPYHDHDVCHLVRKLKLPIIFYEDSIREAIF